jgi:hypothetical protein
MTDDEQMKEKAIISIQSCIRGYLQRRHSLKLKHKPLTYETAAILIQKSYRGFRFRKFFHLYKQRLNMQMLCFLQQIELINNDFFTKVVRTNYCVPFKSIESTTNNHINNKQSNKLFQHLFPPPPPLPLPSTCEIFSPLLSRHSDSSNPARLPINTSSIPVPPPLPSALSFPLRSSPSRHQLILTSSSPTSSGSKFAQVRDIFARAETASTPVITHHSIPIKNSIPSNITSSHIIPSIEQTSNSKSITVLNAVQEYQRQHINIHQPVSKRFIQLGNNPISNVNRSPNIGGLRSRGIGHINFNNNNKLQNKQNLPAYVTSSPQQQSKSITRVI